MDRRKFLTTGAGLAPALATMPDAQHDHNSGDRAGGKARVFVTGSADGLGYATAKNLLAQGHDVVVHVRSQARLSAVKELVDQGAVATIGDLSDLAQIRDLASQVNDIGPMDAVIHNAGVLSGSQVLVVNVVAPYLLTAQIQRPKRLVYLSSSMHRGGAPAWTAWIGQALRLGHVTQAWLATSDDPKALISGGYWHHQRRQQTNPAVNDIRFQDLLLAVLARATGATLT